MSKWGWSHHQKVPRLEDITQLHADPLIIWPTRNVEVVVHRGTLLGPVAWQIATILNLSQQEAKKLVAFWFALGERTLRKRHGGGWSRRELRTNPRRRYGLG